MIALEVKSISIASSEKLISSWYSVLEEFKYKLMMRRRSIAERIKAFKIFLTEVYPEEIANLIEDIALHIGNLIYSNPAIFKKFKSRNVLTISSKFIISFLFYYRVSIHFQFWWFRWLSSRSSICFFLFAGDSQGSLT